MQVGFVHGDGIVWGKVESGTVLGLDYRWRDMIEIPIRWENVTGDGRHRAWSTEVDRCADEAG